MTNMKKILVIMFFGINTIFAGTDYGFVFQNKPINPACIAMFNSSLADMPYINSINLNVCQNSNAAFQTTLKNNDGSYYFYNNNKNDASGFYSYKVLGKSANNIYVLNTNTSSGGTLEASNLLLIKFNKSNQYVYNGSSQPKINHVLELKLLGYIIGGDRCVGSFSSVQVIGNNLVIEQHHGNNPLDCNKFKKYSIDLSQA
jgi:hypothetical protein